MECQSEGICYFADLVRQKRTLRAKALSVIVLVQLMCQVELIRIFSLLVQLSEYKDVCSSKKTKQNCVIPKKSEKNAIGYIYI